MQKRFSTKGIIAWKWLPSDGRICHTENKFKRGWNKIYTPGTADEQPVLCAYGFHASRTLKQASRFYDHERNALALVELEGPIHEDTVDKPKLCALRMRIICKISFARSMPGWRLRSKTIKGYALRKTVRERMHKKLVKKGLSHLLPRY